MPQSSKSSQGNGASGAHSWLVKRVYEPKRERTLELVKQSVDALLKRKERVSLASITAISKRLDPGGQGISESAILGNELARAYYEQHRSWKGTARKGSVLPSLPSHSHHVKPDRDLERARQRYLRTGKATLVERLLAVEQEYAEQREHWLVQQDELLQWRLRAETAEARLKGGKRS